MALREGERALDLGGALGELDRVEDHHGAAGGPVALDPSERRGRAAAREDRGLALDVRQRIRGRGLVEAALAAEVRRQAHRDARAAGDQRELGGTGAEVDQMAFADRIGDRSDAGRAQLAEPRADRGRTLVDHGMRQQPDRPPALPLQHPHQVAVRHRRQRMVAHVAVGEQLVADEQMAQIDAPAVLGQRRAGDRHLGSKCLGASLTGPILPRRSNRRSSSI